MGMFTERTSNIVRLQKHCGLHSTRLNSPALLRTVALTESEFALIRSAEIAEFFYLNSSCSTPVIRRSRDAECCVCVGSRVLYFSSKLLVLHNASNYNDYDFFTNKIVRTSRPYGSRTSSWKFNNFNLINEILVSHRPRIKQSLFKLISFSTSFSLLPLLVEILTERASISILF